MLALLRLLKSPAVVHDVLLYAASFFTLWGASVPGGVGWAAAIAAAPAAASALVREVIVTHQTNQVNQAIAAQQHVEANVAQAHADSLTAGVAAVRRTNGGAS